MTMLAALRRLAPLLIVVLGLFSFGASLVAGYGEEPNLPFLDPVTGEALDEDVSSIHFDLAYAMAVCAGFNEPEARTIQIVSQLTDIQHVGSYSIGVGSLPAIPPATAVCGADLNLVFPVPSQIECPGCFASRFGPFSPLFHYPHDTPQELGQVRAWAYGERQQLESFGAFAYGGTQVINATCIYTPTLVVDTGTIRPGSLEAFGIYLHGLGDHWSHRDCIAALDAGGEPWGTHTNDYNACRFTAHALEFGPPNANTTRTLDGVKALYAALRSRSLTREGTFIAVDPQADSGWLDQQFFTFVHSWGYANPEPRRTLAATIANACQTRRDAACPDYNLSGTVDVADLQAIALRWKSVAPPDSAYDRDGDLDTDVADIMLVAARWNQPCP